MKGIVSILEVLTVGIILLMALVFFFPHYSIRSEWSSVLLSVKARDTLNTIERMNNTLEFAKNKTKFDDFMRNVFVPSTSGAMIWWKETEDLENYTEDMEIPYFTEGYKETIVDIDKQPYEYSVDSSTVALWHFNENGGIITNDETTNNNDGTIYGASWSSTDCISGSCLSFDGVDDCISVSDDSSLDFGASGNFTIEAWFKSDSDENMRIVYKFSTGPSKGYAIFFGFNEPGTVYGIIWDGAPQTVNSSAGWNDGQWHHVAFVRDRASDYLFLYVDGVLRDYEEETIDATLENTGDLYMGCDYNPLYFFNGTIDEVRILNRSLGGEEIRDDFSGKYDPYSFTLGLGYPY